MSEVCSAVLTTTEQPAASAGPIFQASISSGKFHGMIWPTTPSGAESDSSVSMSCAHPAWW